MTLEYHVGDPKLLADLPHFILKKLAKRLDKLEIHFFRQAADIVMRLYRDR